VEGGGGGGDVIGDKVDSGGEVRLGDGRGWEDRRGGQGIGEGEGVWRSVDEVKARWVKGDWVCGFGSRTGGGARSLGWGLASSLSDASSILSSIGGWRGRLVRALCFEWKCLVRRVVGGAGRGS